MRELRFRSHQPEFEPGFLAHAVAVPGRGPDQLDPRLCHAGDTADRGLDLARHALRDRAGRGRQRHLDIDDAALLDVQLVAQPEIDEVDRDLRVADGLPRLQPRLQVTRAWNCANSFFASWMLLPFSTSVISEAAAVEIAQPRPSKLTSAIRSPSTARYTVTRSPQSGLWPRARCVGCSSA